jgi:hypothetical protein
MDLPLYFNAFVYDCGLIIFQILPSYTANVKCLKSAIFHSSIVMVYEQLLFIYDDPHFLTLEEHGKVDNFEV